MQMIETLGKLLLSFQITCQNSHKLYTQYLSAIGYFEYGGSARIFKVELTRFASLIIFAQSKYNLFFLEQLVVSICRAAKQEADRNSANAFERFNPPRTP